jgi:hypothetical protein
VITPLPSGEGKGEGPAGEGGVACWGRGRGRPGREYEPALQLDTNSKGIKAENNN